MLKKVVLIFFLISCGALSPICFAQETEMKEQFVALWEKGKMPNSKGIAVKDEIRDERVYAVGTPGFYAFFPSRQENKRAAVLICPGGGYERLAYQISGVSLAKWLNTLGVAAFVLNYRLPTSPDLTERSLAPLEDAAQAMRIIRANAEKWGIDAGKVGVLGTSAGGHLAAALGTATEDGAKVGDALDAYPFAPNFMILISPVITMGEFAHATSKKNLLGANPSKELTEKFSLETRVTARTPPAFIVHAADDRVVSPRNSLMFYSALLEKNVRASLHIFPAGGHSIALKNNPGATALWTTLCEMWLGEMNFLAPLKK